MAAGRPSAAGAGFGRPCHTSNPAAAAQVQASLSSSLSSPQALPGARIPSRSRGDGSVISSSSSLKGWTRAAPTAAAASMVSLSTSSACLKQPLRRLLLPLSICLALTLTATATAPGDLWPYNEDVARAFATLTQASYCDEATDRETLKNNWTCEECEPAGFQIEKGSVRFVEHSEFWQENSTFMVVARMKAAERRDSVVNHDTKKYLAEELDRADGCVVSVRGTETLTNWLRDLQIWHTPVDFDWCEGCTVEDGFYSITKNTMPELVKTLRESGCMPAQEIEQLRGTANPQGLTNALYMTGHSLGAAISTLLMALLSQLGFEVRLSHIFESPRVGNDVFAKTFKQEFGDRIPVWRLTYHKDPFPHVPMAKTFGYTHVDYEVHYEEDGSYVICNETESPLGANQYSLLSTLMYSDEHCVTPLATKGSLCWCPWLIPPSLEAQSEDSVAYLV